MKTPISVWLFFAIAFIYQIFLSFQGFDMCDEGWCLSFYQNFFSSPQSATYNFAYYLTGLVGGTADLIFPQGGILYLRVLNTVVVMLICLVVYRMLRETVKTEYIIIGLSVVILNFNYGVLAFHHNYLTALILLGALFCLMDGLKKSSFIRIGISGFLLALAVFTRLPNILMVVLAMLIIINARNLQRPYSHALSQILYAICGFIAGVLVMYITMNLLGHWELFVESIKNIVDKGAASDSNHNIFTMLETTIITYRDVFFDILILLALFSLLIFGENRTKHSKYLRVTFRILAGIVMLVLCWRMVNVFLIYAFSFIGLYMLITNKKISHNLKLIAWGAVLILVFNPMGSDSGIGNFGNYCLWLAVPLAIQGFMALDSINRSIVLKRFNFNLSIDHRQITLFVMLFVISLSMVNLYKVSRSAYFDPGSRFDKVFALNASLADNIYTTSQRSAITNDLLDALAHYVKPGDYLFAYDNIPMVNYLTKTHPYLGTSWVWVYDSHSFEREIRKSERMVETRPVVVMQKFITIGKFSEPITDYMSEDRADDYLWNSKRTGFMNQFLNRNGYQIVWSNSYFDILLPNE